eukprot:4169438-Amphidinium_carterae.1
MPNAAVSNPPCDQNLKRTRTHAYTSTHTHTSLGSGSFVLVFRFLTLGMLWNSDPTERLQTGRPNETKIESTL